MRSSFLALGLCLSPVLFAQYMAGNAAMVSKVDEQYQAGERALRAAHYAAAIAAFDLVLAGEPDHMKALLHRGFCHSVLQQHAQAVVDLSRVIAANPDNAMAYTCRSAAYMGQGHHDLAISDMDHVLQLDPENEEAFNLRLRAFEARGDQLAACPEHGSGQGSDNDEAKIILNNIRSK